MSGDGFTFLRSAQSCPLEQRGELNAAARHGRAGIRVPLYGTVAVAAVRAR